jgi:hypothetical protein
MTKAGTQPNPINCDKASTRFTTKTVMCPHDKYSTEELMQNLHTQSVTKPLNILGAASSLSSHLNQENSPRTIASNQPTIMKLPAPKSTKQTQVPARLVNINYTSIMSRANTTSHDLQAIHLATSQHQTQS